MKLADIGFKELSLRLGSKAGLTLQVGQFKASIRSTTPKICKSIFSMYKHSEVFDDDCADFHVQIKRSSGLRFFFKPYVTFNFNGQSPFAPLPLDQAYPLLEWGLNWCVSKHCHQYLLIHAAVLEKNGQTIILPGTPGSGKSTLCAAMVCKGQWRLLSDELTMYDYKSETIAPNPRPISLKNDSIKIIKNYSPESIFSEVISDTIKGSVAHMRPSLDSVNKAHVAVKPTAIIFPKYNPEVESEFHQLAKGSTFLELANHSFNYSILGAEGFKAVGTLLDQTKHYSFEYNGNLENALDVMDSIF